ncbi:hypothetical protein GGR55DRAFT_673180 [Xylaria sp. FL0064]|nr:hypothetical protein GGR55DRAFT_673180 [Xylaria sp. FL0064]
MEDGKSDIDGTLAQRSCPAHATYLAIQPIEARVPEQCTWEPHPRAALNYLTVHVPGSSPRPALRRASRFRGHGRPRSRSDGACTDHHRLRPASGAILVAAGVLVAMVVGKRAKRQKDGGLGRRGVSPAQAVLEFQSLYPFPSGVGGLSSTVLIGDAS